MGTKLGSEYFQTLLTLILEQREEAFHHFNLPLVLYRNQGFAILQREDDLEHWLTTYRESLKPRGIAMVKVEIIEQLKASPDMSSYLVEQYFCSQGGFPIFNATLKYFVRETGDAQAIEMIEQL